VAKSIKEHASESFRIYGGLLVSIGWIRAGLRVVVVLWKSHCLIIEV